MKEEKTILGLDLGTTSLGWAIIEILANGQKRIKHLGVRIHPLPVDSKNEFEKGQAISINQARTDKRGARRNLDRYQDSREKLKAALKGLGMLPSNTQLLKLDARTLYGLRAKAVKEQITLPELGRILLHLRQRRGYKSAKDDFNDSSQSKYLEAVGHRYRVIQEKGITIGEFFYAELEKDLKNQKGGLPTYRIKEQVFPRKAYIEEFDRIWETQAAFYPEVLNDVNRKHLRDEILYYQRPLKSQKGLVAICEFEGEWKEIDGKEQFIGPRVAPVSSPLALAARIWENINNISIHRKDGPDYQLNPEEKQKIFNHLQTHETLKEKKLFDLLNLNKNEGGFYTNKQIRDTGLKGNSTLLAIAKALKKHGGSMELLRFDLHTESYEHCDKSTGELSQKERIAQSFEKEPLYQLWHVLYSIDSPEELSGVLHRKYGFSQELASALMKIDFRKKGFGKRSAKFIRKLLPHLQQGLKYSMACEAAGYKHSDSETKEEREAREVSNEPIKLLKKNALRQPVVEKILNQMINLVNAIRDPKQGLGIQPDEIRVELARELKQSKKEREKTFKDLGARTRKREDIEKRLLEYPWFKKKHVSKNDVDRYMLWEEFDRRSPYEPSKSISLQEVYDGSYEIEHIIPKSLLFDDSYGNKTLCRRELNSGDRNIAKNNQTAYDFMKQRGQETFQSYLDFVHAAYEDKKITKGKLKKLTTTADDLKEGLIERQLRQTQYISKKATELLTQICKEVNVTSGSVSAYLRKIWGWDDVLMQLNLPKYQRLGMTEPQRYYHNGQWHEREVIPTWHKRDDHRHHVVDALVVACTEQGFIQRLNTLNADETQDHITFELEQIKDPRARKNRSRLDQYFISKRPFHTAHIKQHVAGVVISFKAGKRVAKGNNPQNLVPRGALSEESVYGKIKRRAYRDAGLNKNFTLVDQIADKELRTLIQKRLDEFDNKPEKAFANLKKNPIEWEGQPIKKVRIWEWVEEYVIKQPITKITTETQLQKVVDPVVREKIRARWEAFDNKPKDAYKNLEENPIWYNQELNIPIKSVRCYTGAKEITPVKVYDKSWNIVYEKYLIPGNNHHVALYEDEKGKRQEQVITFWHAVERKKHGLNQVVIQEPQKAWDEVLKKGIDDQHFLSQLPPAEWKYVLSMQQNELFVFDLELNELKQLIKERKYDIIAPLIFKVRKLSSGQYWFNHIYETLPRESVADKKAGRCKQVSPSGMNGIKIKVDNLGRVRIPEKS